MFIRTSCVYLFLLKPFWALLHILFTTLSSLRFRAREISLYRFDKREMGFQFFMEEQLPFFGMSLILAALKLFVSSPLLKQHTAYFKRGLLRKSQHFLMTKLLKPSIPAADLRLHFLREMSSSSRVKLPSKVVNSATFSLELVTTGLEQMFSPRNSSIT